MNFEAVVKSVGVKVVQSTEKREGGEYTVMTLSFPYTAEAFARAKELLGQDVSVDMNPKQLEMFETGEGEAPTK
jgi:hypothetical protein